MDSISQAALGASVAGAVFGKKASRPIIVLGAVIATIPDMDVLLTPFFTELQKISIHRGYSHSILFSILGALGIAYVLSRLKWTASYSYAKLVFFSWLVLFTHLLLDTFTSYGTQLLLPFSNARIGFDSISIVDPLYTLPLLIGLVLAYFVFKNKPHSWKFNAAGLVISSIYLLSTLAFKAAAENQFEQALNEQGVSYNKLLTVPVGLGPFSWYGVAKSNEGLYITPGSINSVDEAFQFFPTNDSLLNRVDPEMKEVLTWFSKDYYVVSEKDDTLRLYNMQCDMQGIREYGGELVPTAFYFQMVPEENGAYDLSVGMHP